MMRLLLSLCLLSGLGCAVDGGTGALPSAGDGGGAAKADGILDAFPTLEFDTPIAGEVGENRAELYKLALRRGDVIELSMAVTEGDLRPHILVYQGLSRYIAAESWSQDGDVLRKSYRASTAASYSIAAKAYQGRGSGRYTITARCVGGPCAGEISAPPEDMSSGEAADCIGRARVCALGELPSLGGRVGAAAARRVFEQCLTQSALPDGASCAKACDWVAEEDDEDASKELCDDIIRSLPFYADQSAACLTALNGCMDDCAGMTPSGFSDGQFSYTSEALCWKYGFNGNCDSFARAHEVCGGDVKSSGARECELYCLSTTGAHYDDTDTLCSDDLECGEYCDVEREQVRAICGGLTAGNRGCIEAWLNDNAWMCFDTIVEEIG